MSTYKLHVRSRGKDRDYEWIDGESTVCSPMLSYLEGSTLYALCILKKAGWYHGAMHIYMPENRDKHGGFIRLEIAIENMSEKQARALSIAYLKLPINGDNRIWVAAQKTYAPKSDGFCKVDIPKLQEIIDEAIEENVSGLSNKKPEYKLHLLEAHTNKGGMKEKAIEHLRQYSLTLGDGIKIFLNDQIKQDEADLLLQHDNSGAEEDSVQEIKLPEPKKPSGIDMARELAEKLRAGIESLPTAPKKYTAWYVTGIAIFVILLLIIGYHQKTSDRVHMRIQDESYRRSIPCEIIIPSSPNGEMELEIQIAPAESTIILNGNIIGKGQGKYRIPAEGGILKVLPPNS